MVLPFSVQEVLCQFGPPPPEIVVTFTTVVIDVDGATETLLPPFNVAESIVRVANTEVVESPKNSAVISDTTQYFRKKLNIHDSYFSTFSVYWKYCRLQISNI